MLKAEELSILEVLSLGNSVSAWGGLGVGTRGAELHHLEMRALRADERLLPILGESVFPHLRLVTFFINLESKTQKALKDVME
jgi:hypothetical protein